MKKKKQIHSTETTNKQDPRPYYPVKLLRNSLFSPYRKEKIAQNVEMNFFDGNIKISAQSALNQTHKLIIDTILMLAHKNDSFFVLQSPIGLPIIACVIRYSDLIKIYNKNSDILKQNIKDIVQTALEMDVKTVCTMIEPIISTVVFSPSPSFLGANSFLGADTKEKIENKIQEIVNDRNPKQRSNNYTPKNETIQENSVFVVVFSSIFTTMLRINLRINYSPEILAKLRKIKSGAVLAIINFILTQKTPYTIKAETIADHCKINLATIALKDKYFYILKKHTETFAEFGIEYDSTKKMFSYSVNNPEIGFSMPPNDVLGTFMHLEEVKNSPERTAALTHLKETIQPNN